MQGGSRQSQRAGQDDPGSARVGHGPSRVRTITIEASEPWPVLDDPEVEEWRILVTLDGIPCVHLTLPAGAGPSLLEATAGRHAGLYRAERDLRERLRERIGSPPPPEIALAVSVVICTHRRREQLSRLLGSLGAVDPGPAEIVVVDNDPGRESCEAEVALAGARYLREDTRGLNNARRAGLAAAHGDVVAFVDDDCVVPPGWLAQLPRLFADPTVGAVTGPAFAHELVTRPQVLRDQIASLEHGLAERRFDWTRIWAVHSGQVGAGANMILRRSALGPAEELFPAELDAGTPTRSGGDLYALYKLLAAGHRIAYDPASYVYHRHAEDRAALLATIDGYGIGLSAFLTRGLVVDREPAVFAVWWWLMRGWTRATLDLITGQGDREEMELRRHYLLGGFKGGVAWARARRIAATPQTSERSGTAAEPDPPEDALGAPGTAPAPAAGAVPLISVIIPGPASGPELDRTLRALDAQQRAPAWETLIGTDRPDRIVPVRGRGQGETGAVRVIDAPSGERSALINLAAGAARGKLLLILAPGTEPEPGLLGAHARGHATDPTGGLVVGRTVSVPERSGLAALARRLRDEDDFRLTREAAAPTFPDLPASNYSLPRATFERLGGLDRRLGPRGAARDLGVRALRSGIALACNPDCVVRSDLSTETATYVEEPAQEGRDDRLLLASWPDVAHSLPERLRVDHPGIRAVEGCAILLFRSGRARAAAVPLLAVLEAARLRRAWSRLAELARRGAYERGLGRAARRALRRAANDDVEVIDLSVKQRMPPPAGIAPRISLVARGLRSSPLRPPQGRWHDASAKRSHRRRRGDQHRAYPPSSAALISLAAARCDRWEELTGRAGAVPERPLDGLEVLAVSGAEARNTVPALEVAGAAVGVMPPAPTTAEHWDELRRAMAASDAELIALPLPGVQVRPEAITAVTAAFTLERTAMVLCAGVERSEPPSPIGLLPPKGRHRPGFYAYRGLPAQVLVVRRRAYEAVGGLDPAAARLGAQAPPLDLLERALNDGWIAGYAEVPGIDPPVGRNPPYGRQFLQRTSARGALIARDAAAMGATRGALHLAARAGLPIVRRLGQALTGREVRVASWLGGTTAFVAGIARGLRAARSTRAAAGRR